MLNAMLGWLVEQRYVLANPFAGVHARVVKGDVSPAGRAFTKHEWRLVRKEADRLSSLG